MYIYNNIDNQLVSALFFDETKHKDNLKKLVISNQIW